MWFLIIEMSVVSWIICPFCSVFSVFSSVFSVFMNEMSVFSFSIVV